MRVSFNWLRELVDIEDDIQTIVNLFSNMGLEVEEVLQIGDDTVFDIEVTPQRPDLLGMWGIARELAIFLNKKPKLPKHKILRKKLDGISVKIDDPVLCCRYSCGVVKNIQTRGTPKWIKQRLVVAGSIPQDSIVDIGNYVMYETAQPIHIFDLDKISENIVVRTSKEGEFITTLDGVRREVPEDVLLICDGEIPVAIAGIMGGSDTMVTDTTKDVLIESAYFDPVIIRKGGKKLGISTEASYRFERGGDVGMTNVALHRVMSLLEDCYGAKSDGTTDKYPHKIEEKSLKISTESVNRILGSSLSEDEILACIKRLGFETEDERVKIPSYRRDMSFEVDLVEEIARLEGYDKFSPETPFSLIIEKEKSFEDKIRDTVVSLGFNEVYTLPLVRNGNIRIMNWMRDDMRALRTNLIEALLSVLVYNKSYGTTSLRIFEVGRVFNRDCENIEHTELAAIIAGGRVRNPLWASEGVDFADLKGILEAMFGMINLEGWNIVSSCTQNYDPGCSIKLGEDTLGYMGRFKHEILKRLDVDFPVYGMELDISKIKSTGENVYNPISKFPCIVRDISIVVDKEVPAISILDFAKKRSPDTLQNLTIFDYYKGRELSTDKVAVGLRFCFRGRNCTLKKADVDQVVTSITNDLLREYNAELRYK
jgi:phenylalanyl-tRNA synthetase beta chain